MNGNGYKQDAWGEPKGKKIDLGRALCLGLLMDLGHYF